ncbi:hypothetical protein QWZ10_23285 [Paracoccus cavernae]|uniref:Uncharacterized protein n=1 Tax=Paracoccus cavernae TaxID=1571207 RepID=A0ABT8DAY1_9RHOB|nr:hypothetical protein [Paracoccus cavernae]
MGRLTGFWGLLSAYWRSERWREAWTLTAIVFVLTTVLSKASVWVALASADFMAALVNIQPASGDSALSASSSLASGHVVLMAAGAYLAIFLARTAGWRCAISSPRRCTGARAGWSRSSTMPFSRMNGSRST